MKQKQKSILKSDPCVKSIIHCYSAVEDWLENVPLIGRGGRTVERLSNIQNNGVIPLAEHYFHFVLEYNDVDTKMSEPTIKLIKELQKGLAPDYVEMSLEHDFSTMNRSLVRILVEPNLRLGYIAVQAGQDINAYTNHHQQDHITEEFANEIDDIWIEWWNELNDLYWERRYKLSHEILREQEKGDEFPRELTFKRFKRQYPEMPNTVDLQSQF